MGHIRGLWGWDRAWLRCLGMQADGTEKKMGAYLMKTCFQTSTISSAMFITAMAANPLAVDLAKDALGQTISWGQWALAGAQHASSLATKQTGKEAWGPGRILSCACAPHII